MFDDVFSGAVQTAADNDMRDVMAMPDRDAIVLEVKVFDSEVMAIVDELMQHHWVQGKVQDGWAITPRIVKQALIAHLKSVVADYVNVYGADDHMHGTLGTRLQHEILEAADKQPSQQLAA
jgi:hypothetical protein